MKARKKPVVVDAWRYDPMSGEEADVYIDVLKWISAEYPETDLQLFRYSESKGFQIHTLEHKQGDEPLTVSPGDYIIRGVVGEFYPCKPDVFDKTYDGAAEGDRVMIVAPTQIGILLEREMTIGDLFAQVLADKETSK